jgi:23S rRNA pseudouridine955/2504/2580 synthase
MPQFTIGSEEAGCRVDRIARKKLALMPLSSIYALIRKRKIRVNCRKTVQSYHLCEGDVLSIDVDEAEIVQPAVPDSSLANLTRTTFFRNNFRILFEDEDLMSCDKPAGLVVHAGSGHSNRDTLIDLAQAYLLEKGYTTGPSLVHRLDRDTSGVILIAKNKRTLRKLHDTFKERSITKEYRALCHGRPPENEATISVSLSRSDSRNSGMKMRVDDSGMTAESRYTLQSFYNDISNVAIFLETGKTHQIRVQMAHIGAPVIGDVRYGSSEKDTALLKNFPRRLYLHAYRLSFIHPVTGKKLVLKAPLPKAFSLLLNRY